MRDVTNSREEEAENGRIVELGAIRLYLHLEGLELLARRRPLDARRALSPVVGRPANAGTRGHDHADWLWGWIVQGRQGDVWCQPSE